MKVEDIKNVLALAKVALDNGREHSRPSANEIAANSIAAVEAWLIQVGALTATVKGAKVLDARSRAVGKAGTKRRR